MITQSHLQRRFANDTEVAAITGISRSTLQRSRRHNNSPFPWYRVGRRRVLYDLDEVEAIIRNNVRGRTAA